MKRFSSLGWMAVVVTLTLVAFSGLVAADPPLPPDTGEATESWTAAPSLQACETGFDEASNELEYCDDLQVHRKTKQITCCTSGGDSGICGDFENPNPFAGQGRNHQCWNFDPSAETETRTYLVCGDGVDGEEKGSQVPNSVSNPIVTDEAVNNMDNTETTDISKDWSCPSVKPLSERHDQGELETGFGLSGAGYQSLDSLHFEAGQDMSFRKTVVIPACVNRVPMTRLNVELDDNGETVSEKTSISASHMNMYYGPEGDNRGALREVELPEQDAFLKTYNPEAQLDSYRMWAWRQRFAGALEETVQEKDLELPEETDVAALAEDYADSGVSVGNLWLTADFLFGAQAPDEDGEPEVITREITGECTVNADDFEQFDDVDDVDTFVSNNPDDAKDLLGKGDGTNHCGLGENETLAEIGEVRDTGAFEEESENVDGTVSTKIFANTTAVETAVLNVTDLNVDPANASEFVTLFNDDEADATSIVREHKNELDIDHIDVAVIQGLEAVSERTDDEVEVDVDYTRWPTAEEIDSRDQDVLYTSVESNLLDGEGFLSDGGIEPVAQFGDRMINDVHDVTTIGEQFSVNMTFGTSVITRDSYQAYVEITTLLEEESRNTWNWRALQEVSMTDLARCMYNWDQCFDNSRSLDADWDGKEIFDAGFGPRVGTFTYQWSEDSVENSTEDLQENYNVDASAEFNKYYDGASGTETTDLMDVKVYRPCETDEAWINQETDNTLYEDNQFVCSDNDDTAYYCDYSAGNLPGYVESADVGSFYEVNGDYYVCQDTGNVPKWRVDNTAPEVTCDDCIEPSEATVGSEITVEFSVQEQGTPLDRASVCWDQNCEDVIFEGTSGSFTVDEARETSIWAEVEDEQGNVNVVELGTLKVARAIGESCESDSQCLSGNCQDFECVTDVAPIIDIL